MISRYFETFYIQEQTSIPNPWYPQFSTEPYTFGFGDGREVKGKFLQSQTDEILIAHAMGTRTHGRFVTAIDAPIDKHTTLRRANDGFFFALEGDPIEAPEQAFVKLKVYEARVTDRPVANPLTGPATTPPGGGWEGWD